MESLWSLQGAWTLCRTRCSFNHEGKITGTYLFLQHCSSQWRSSSFSFLFPQAKAVLQSFLRSQVAIGKSILQADRALTDKEKAMAGTGRVGSRWAAGPAVSSGSCESKTFLQQGAFASSVGRTLLNLKTFGHSSQAGPFPPHCELCS